MFCMEMSNSDQLLPYIYEEKHHLSSLEGIFQAKGKVCASANPRLFQTGSFSTYEKYT